MVDYNLFYGNASSNYNLSYDPFGNNADATQSHRTRALVSIKIGDTDVTDRLNPYLISVRIISGTDMQYYCEIELDDRDGQLPIPPLGTSVYVLLGWTTESLVHTFQGTTNDCEHSFERKGGGRRMTVYAMGANYFAKIKAPMQMHLGDGAPPGQDQGSLHGLPDWLNMVSAAGGGTISVHPDFQSVQRDYWSINNESFIHHAQRLAQEHGAWFNVINGTQGIFSKHGQAPDGTTIYLDAIWGQNLISWRVRPWAARSIWKQTAQQFFDISKGQWTTNMKDLMQGFAKFQAPQPAATSQIADQQNDGNLNNSLAGQGGGRILINGEPKAQGGMCFVTVKGARPGVDGLWLVTTAEHIYSRDGYFTWLTVTPVSSSGIIQDGSNTNQGYNITDGNSFLNDFATTSGAFTSGGVQAPESTTGGQQTTDANAASQLNIPLQMKRGMLGLKK